MKKTFTINISGTIFHIDEDAFEKLNNYLETIKSHFTNTEGRDEIISDIEFRISEMLQSKINEQKQVITIEDIKEVISVMGEPEQISGQDREEAKPETEEPKQRRRLFRDPDNKVLGGVCGGIGAYFNIDPLWIRIGFLITLFVFGSGPLIYLILWIIIPEARSTVEKLEMKGEPVTVSNIQKTIQEEMEGLKNRLNNLKDDAKQAYKKNFKDRHPRTAAEKTLNFILQLLKYFIRFVAIIIGIIFVFIGIFLMVGFISSFFNSSGIIWISSMGVSNFSFPLFLKLFLGSSTHITVALIGLSLLIGIPLLMLVYNGIKLIFGLKSKKKIVGISSVSLWFAGLTLCVIVGLGILSSFSDSRTVKSPIFLKQPLNAMLKIYLQPNEIADSLSEYENKFVIGQWNMVTLNDKSYRFGIPELVILSSDSSDYKVQINYTSRGADKNDALKNIGKIEYNIAQNDTSLVLEPFYKLPENEKWRSQNVKVVIRVPVGKLIYLSPETAMLLDYYENSDNEKNLAGKKLIMTTDGLKEFSSAYISIPSDTIKTDRKDTVQSI